MPKDDVRDLKSLFLESSECRAVTAKLEPIIDGIEESNDNYTANCATDSYATNVLWQVRTYILIIVA